MVLPGSSHGLGMRFGPVVVWVIPNCFDTTFQEALVQFQSSHNQAREAAHFQVELDGVLVVTQVVKVIRDPMVLKIQVLFCIGLDSVGSLEKIFLAADLEQRIVAAGFEPVVSFGRTLGRCLLLSHGRHLQSLLHSSVRIIRVVGGPSRFVARQRCNVHDMIEQSNNIFLTWWEVFRAECLVERSRVQCLSLIDSCFITSAWVGAKHESSRGFASGVGERRALRTAIGSHPAGVGLFAGGARSEPFSSCRVVFEEGLDLKTFCLLFCKLILFVGTNQDTLEWS
mmetsp:Transcript_19707/g.42441  ORF Transcript_19707/g.42441 Transcript_19707/m.42441 type:complete len:283 (-) Transcript_19707:4557-5405(-)